MTPADSPALSEPSSSAPPADAAAGADALAPPETPAAPPDPPPTLTELMVDLATYLEAMPPGPSRAMEALARFSANVDRLVEAPPEA